MRSARDATFISVTTPLAAPVDAFSIVNCEPAKMTDSKTINISVFVSQLTQVSLIALVLNLFDF
jgi:hypothetical protein